jgi:hypothetical protein
MEQSLGLFKNKVMRKIHLFICLLLLFFFPADTYAQSKLKKTEILYLKWGDKPDQIGFDPGDAGHPNGPGALGMDSKGDIYITDTQNEAIKVFKPSGKLIRNISLYDVAKKWVTVSKGTQSLPSCVYFKSMIVDDGGNIFVPLVNPDPQRAHLDVFRIKPDGEVMDLNLEEAPTGADGAKKGEPVSVYGKHSKTALRVFPNLIWDDDYEVELDQDSSTLILHWAKVKAHYPSLSSLPEAVTLKAPGEEAEGEVLSVIGVDETGKIFVFVDLGYRFVCPGCPEDVFGDDILVYSPEGKRVAEMNPISDICYGSGFFKVDDRGNLYQLVSLKDGVHLFRWSLSGS